jgi:hypothetical protein
VLYGVASYAESDTAASCAAPEYHQFDFWLGDWDVFEIGGKAPVARVKITPALDGCALREQYLAADRHVGESLSIYDSAAQLWHQSWFTNRGQFLAIEGNYKNGEMDLSGVGRAPDGRKRLVRGIWKPEGHNVRETAFRSTDDGKSWELWFDLEFRPHQ